MLDRHGTERKKEFTEPEGALEVPTPLDTDRASAPQHYDTQRKSEQVWQEGTEAIIKVSQFKDSKQEANSKTLHEKPDLRPSEPLLSTPTALEDNNKSEAKEEDLTSHLNYPAQTHSWTTSVHIKPRKPRYFTRSSEFHTTH